jgi:hypothetical protein
MTPETFAKAAIHLASIALPFLIFVAGNTFTSRMRTFVHAIAAIACGWGLTVAYAIAARAITLSVANPQEQLAIFDTDGAPLAFAAVFGWVPSVLIVAIVWTFRTVRR